MIQATAICKNCGSDLWIVQRRLVLVKPEDIKEKIKMYYKRVPFAPFVDVYFCAKCDTPMEEETTEFKEEKV